MALTDSLISYWSLDEASGNALDAHGSNDLTDNNTVGSATGKINGARDFESSNSEYFARADNSDLSTGDIDFTFACWVQLESKPGSRMTIAAKMADGTPANNSEWGVFWSNTADRFQTIVSDGSSGFVALSANNFGAPSTAAWYFVVAWHDSSANTLNIQVNNGTVDSVSYSSGLINSTAAFHLGRITAADGQYWDGLIDEAGFWKRVLTSDERTSLYNSGNGLAYPFTSNYTLTAASGSFALTGQDATLTVARLLIAGAGSFTLTGQDAALTYSPIAAPVGGSGWWPARRRRPLRHRRLLAEPSLFTVQEQPASLNVGRRLLCEPGAYHIDSAGRLLAGRRLRAIPGVFRAVLPPWTVKFMRPFDPATEAKATRLAQARAEDALIIGSELTDL